MYMLSSIVTSLATELVHMIVYMHWSCNVCGYLSAKVHEVPPGWEDRAMLGDLREYLKTQAATGKFRPRKGLPEL